MADRLDEMRAAVRYYEQQLYIAKNRGLGVAGSYRRARARACDARRAFEKR